MLVGADPGVWAPASPHGRHTLLLIYQVIILNKYPELKGTSSILWMFQESEPIKSRSKSNNLTTHLYTICTSLEEPRNRLSSCRSFQHNMVAVGTFICGRIKKKKDQKSVGDSS